ncbi:MAG: hypothetical protein V6Z89_15875 [Desulfobacter sp.]
MKLVFIFFLSVILVTLSGCSPHRLDSVSRSDEVWNEDFNDELREMGETGQTYHTTSENGTTDRGRQFFIQHKPQIKTVQLWLESGKVITGKIKDYLASVMPGADTERDQTLPRGKLIGRWYGLDRRHEGAIVVIFQNDGRFSWQAPEETRTGVFEVDGSVSPHRITLIPATPPETQTTSFEFINDKAILFKCKDRDIILFKEG